MNEHDIKEAFVTDHMSSEQLHKMMNNPAFGSFDSYRPLDNMEVETIKAEQHDDIGPHGAVSTVKRYFKFVKSDDGWEVYEVDAFGEKLGEVFRLNESVNQQYRFTLPFLSDEDNYYQEKEAKKYGLQFRFNSKLNRSGNEIGCMEFVGDKETLQKYLVDHGQNDDDIELVESVEGDLEIPAPYNQYYEFSPNEVNFDELPDAFDHYKDLKVIAELYAKEQYEDALADNCLDFCWLVEDEIGKLLLVTTAGLRVYPITLEEIQDCVGDAIDEDFNAQEPSSVEYGNFITNHYKEIDNVLQKYGITKMAYRRSTEYTGNVNGHKFFFVEGNTGTGHYAKELYIDGKEVNLYQSGNAFYKLNDMNQFGIMSLVRMLEHNKFDGLVFRDVDTLDDYEESLVEDTQMSDAQRLALQELDACLDCGELDAEKHALAYQIQWDINFEDVILFINGIGIDLKDIKHVEYGDCDETKFDGCYNVTLQDGTTKQYGWYDSDMTGSLTLIESTLTENSDGWEKPFNWTERYVKDGFVITTNYNGGWHLEQTRPVAKHIDNFKTLEDAKAAGDAAIEERKSINSNKEIQWGVHQFSADDIVFRGTEEECAKYIDDNDIWSDAEVYMITPDDPHYLELTEDVRKRFNPGDHVYVTVANRGGHVIKMISDDVVEVELKETFLFPARIDRYYVEEVELIATDDLDDDEDIEGLDPVVIEHPEDMDTYLADPDNKFIPDDEF